MSLAHPDTISHIVALRDGLFATASIDGFVQVSRYHNKFESQKIFKVHSAPLTDLANGHEYAMSVSLDRTAKVYNVLALEVVKVYRLEFIPECCCIVECLSLSSDPIVIAAPRDQTGIYLCKLSEQSLTYLEYSEQILHIVFHRNMQYLLLACASGKIVHVDLKSIIDNHSICEKLYANVGSKPCKPVFSPDSEFVAFLSADRVLRVYRADTLRMHRKFDESTQFYENALQAGRLKMASDRLEKAIAIERELEKTPYFNFQSLCFDVDSRIVLYPCLLGIKAIDFDEIKTVAIYGQKDGIRPVGCILLPEHPEKVLSVEMAASDNPRAIINTTRSVLLTTVFRQPRFCLFADQMAADNENRDLDWVHFPSLSKETTTSDQSQSSSSSTYRPGHKAIIRTSLGDIYIELHPNLTPRTVENFCTLSRRRFYDSLLFHRVIRGFMIQTGCPRGDGTGGECIWGGTFANELCPELRHDRPYVVSMANSGGSRSNGSQFFITTIRAPWLDRKHTVFGRVAEGTEVVKMIESVETDRLDRPKEDVRVLAIEIVE